MRLNLHDDKTLRMMHMRVLRIHSTNILKVIRILKDYVKRVDNELMRRLIEDEDE